MLSNTNKNPESKVPKDNDSLSMPPSLPKPAPKEEPQTSIKAFMSASKITAKDLLIHQVKRATTILAKERITAERTLEADFYSKPDQTTIPEEIINNQKKREQFIEWSNKFIHVIAVACHSIPVAGKPIASCIQFGGDFLADKAKGVMDIVKPLTEKEANKMENEIKKMADSKDVPRMLILANKLYGCLKNDNFSVEQKSRYVPALAKLYKYTLETLSSEIFSAQKALKKVEKESAHMKTEIADVSSSLNKTISIVQQQRKDLEAVMPLVSDHEKRLQNHDLIAKHFEENIKNLDKEVRQLGEQQQSTGAMCQILFADYMKVSISGFESNKEIENLFKRYEVTCMSSDQPLQIALAKKELERAMELEVRRRQEFDNNLAMADQACQVVAMAFGYAGYPKAQQTMSYASSGTRNLLTGIGYYLGYGQLIGATGPIGFMISSQYILQGVNYLVEAYKQAEKTDLHSQLMKNMEHLAHYVTEFEKRVGSQFSEVNLAILKIFNEVSILQRDQARHEVRLKELEKQLNKHISEQESRFNAFAQKLENSKIYQEQEVGRVQHLIFNKDYAEIKSFLERESFSDKSKYQLYFDKVSTHYEEKIFSSVTRGMSNNPESNPLIISRLKAYLENHSGQKIQTMMPTEIWQESSLILSQLTSAYLKHYKPCEFDRKDIKILEKALAHGNYYLKFINKLKEPLFLRSLFKGYKQSLANLIAVLREEILKTEQEYTKKFLKDVSRRSEKATDYFYKQVALTKLGIRPTAGHYLFTYFKLYEEEGVLSTIYSSVKITGKFGVKLAVASVVDPLTIPYDLASFSWPFKRSFSAGYEYLTQDIEMSWPDLYVFVDPDKTNIYGEYTISEEKEVCKKLEEEYSSKRERELLSTVCAVFSSESKNDLVFSFFKKLNLPECNLSKKIILPFPESKNSHVFKSKLILPLDSSLPNYTVSYEEKMLELFGEFTVAYYYDVYEEGGKEVLLIYALKISYQSLMKVYEGVAISKLEYEIIRVSTYLINNVPNFINFEERLWLFWVGGACLNLDIEAFPKTKSMLIKNKNAMKAIDSSKDFILIPTFAHISGLSSHVSDFLNHDGFQKKSKNDSSPRLIDEKATSFVHFSNKNSTNQIQKQFLFGLTMLRKELNDKIGLLAENGDHSIGAAIKKLDEQVNLLNTCLKLIGLCGLDELGQSFLKSKQDIIEYIKHHYNGEEYYLDQILENEISILAELESFVLAQLKIYNEPAEFEKNIIGSIKNIVDAISYAGGNKDEQKSYSSVSYTEDAHDSHRKQSTDEPKTSTQKMLLCGDAKAPEKFNDKNVLYYLKILANKNSSERYEVIDSLSKLINAQNRQKIVENLLPYTHDFCPLIRADIFSLLGNHADSDNPKVLNVLFNGLQDSYQLAQLYSSQSLVKLGQSKDVRIIKTLFSLIDNAIHWIAQQAASLLIDLNFYNYSQLEIVLDRGCTHPDDYVKNHAINALTKLRKYKQNTDYSELTELKLHDEKLKSTQEADKKLEVLFPTKSQDSFVRDFSVDSGSQNLSNDYTVYNIATKAILSMPYYQYMKKRDMTTASDSPRFFVSTLGEKGDLKMTLESKKEHQQMSIHNPHTHFSSRSFLAEFKGASQQNIEEDDRWYDGDKIHKLLTHFFGQRSDIFVCTGINAFQGSGDTLRINLQDLQLQEALKLSLKTTLASTLLIPINLGNLHWSALYINFPKENRLNPTVAYFDPYGHEAPQQVLASLVAIYPELNTKNILKSPIKLQKDNYNCGPWVISIFWYLIQKGALPSEEYDINKAREDYDIILQSLRQNIIPDRGYSSAI